MLDWLSDRYGRRGAWLLMFGGLWIVFGLGQLLEPTPARSWVLYEHLPVIVEAVAWWITGAVAVGVGLRGHARPDALGHVALYLMPAIRVLSFTLSWLIYAVSSTGAALGLWHTHMGWSGGWYAALVWSLISVMLRLIADWPNPGRLIPRPPAGAAERL
jgi:hypothetical protein